MWRTISGEAADGKREKAKGHAKDGLAVSTCPLAPAEVGAAPARGWGSQSHGRDAAGLSV
jgi:hypothetical protein